MKIIIDMWTGEEEGALSKWFVSDGASVREGDMIATVALEKTEYEIHAPCSGLINILVKEDDILRTGVSIAEIK